LREFSGFFQKFSVFREWHEFMGWLGGWGNIGATPPIRFLYKRHVSWEVGGILGNTAPKT
jgi:hypothetical protein